jgi:hypothetical protein
MVFRICFGPLSLPWSQTVWIWLRAPLPVPLTSQATAHAQPYEQVMLAKQLCVVVVVVVCGQHLKRA